MLVHARMRWSMRCHARCSPLARRLEKDGDLAHAEQLARLAAELSPTTRELQFYFISLLARQRKFGAQPPVPTANARGGRGARADAAERGRGL